MAEVFLAIVSFVLVLMLLFWSASYQTQMRNLRRCEESRDTLEEGHRFQFGEVRRLEAELEKSKEHVEALEMVGNIRAKEVGALKDAVESLRRDVAQREQVKLGHWKRRCEMEDWSAKLAQAIRLVPDGDDNEWSQRDDVVSDRMFRILKFVTDLARDRSVLDDAVAPFLIRLASHFQSDEVKVRIIDFAAAITGLEPLVMGALQQGEALGPKCVGLGERVDRLTDWTADLASSLGMLPDLPISGGWCCDPPAVDARLEAIEQVIAQATEAVTAISTALRYMPRSGGMNQGRLAVEPSLLLERMPGIVDMISRSAGAETMRLRAEKAELALTERDAISLAARAAVDRARAWFAKAQSILPGGLGDVAAMLDGPTEGEPCRPLSAYIDLLADVGVHFYSTTAMLKARMDRAAGTLSAAITSIGDVAEKTLVYPSCSLEEKVAVRGAEAGSGVVIDRDSFFKP